MGKMKNIVIPTDFSDHAWNAIFTALKLFPASDCQFTLLNAYEPKAGGFLGEKTKKRLDVLYESMETYSIQQLVKNVDYLKENHSTPKHQFDYCSIRDDLTGALESLEPKMEIDLIVMGTQGASKKRGVFMGSNTVGVIKRIRRYPLLVVPGEYHLQALKKIVFPTDLIRPYHSGELGLLLELVQEWKAELEVCYLTQESQLNEIQQEVKEQLANKLVNVAHSFRQVDKSGHVADVIASYTSLEEADLIVMVHYAHTFLENLTREPVIKKVAFHTDRPLLVLPHFPG